ncbi:unnamed protein product [Musa textilis]
MMKRVCRKQEFLPSLLAKVGCPATETCFPTLFYANNFIILDDIALVKQIKKLLRKLPYSVFSKQSILPLNKQNQFNIGLNNHIQVCGEENADSLDDSSNDCCPTQQAEELFETDGGENNAQRVVSTMGEKIRNQMLDSAQDGGQDELISIDLDYSCHHFMDLKTCERSLMLSEGFS